MLIEFDPIIFDSIENQSKFNYLLNLFSFKRRYEFFIDISKVRDSPIFNSLSAGDQELIGMYFNARIQQSSQIDIQITQNTAEGVFNLDEGITFFNSPVCIILENSLNDKYFLQALINNFSKRGKKIRRFLENRWIEYDNGGGCENIKNVLAEKIESFRGLPKSPTKYLRCFVLVDSDSKYPGDVLQSRTDLRNFLEEIDVDYHFLIKREMENYLPDEAFNGIENNAEYIAAYMRLSPVQKDYFDIEKGFEDKNFDSFAPAIRELYSTVVDSDIAIFRKLRLKMENFKLEFPKLFLGANVTQAGLKRRVEHQGENAGELEVIINKINDLL